MQPPEVGLIYYFIFWIPLITLLEIGERSYFPIIPILPLVLALITAFLGLWSGWLAVTFLWLVQAAIAGYLTWQAETHGPDDIVHRAGDGGHLPANERSLPGARLDSCEHPGEVPGKPARSLHRRLAPVLAASLGGVITFLVAAAILGGSPLSGFGASALMAFNVWIAWRALPGWWRAVARRGRAGGVMMMVDECCRVIGQLGIAASIGLFFLSLPTGRSGLRVYAVVVWIASVFVVFVPHGLKLTRVVGRRRR